MLVAIPAADVAAQTERHMTCYFAPILSRLRHHLNMRLIDRVKVLHPTDRHNIGHFRHILPSQSLEETKIWASAQRDGRPTEYRWRPLFNAAKSG